MCESCVRAEIEIGSVCIHVRGQFVTYGSAALVPSEAALDDGGREAASQVEGTAL